ncbi:MAG TPA: polysaccharide biosynthesis/export family protein [Thermomonas sp.]|jgi:polysaccharide export outer membrane protein|uniref:polysaccharide biosynthesis/export family protein n=1 Tax=Thermomonas sp. TaxID=1971895 RepID=UPI002C811D6D|nr:polysaccharide biosynthesis/export family protein [Thermomonas sp.]HOV96135.1 polysaccharide biosynthesis/export family protein [Thermomonas sp.]
MRNVLTLLLFLMMTSLLVACASGGASGGVPRRSIVNNEVAGNKLPPPDTTAASGAYEGASDYRVGAQDLLEISVFGVQDLDKEVRVNSNGQISLPLIGGVMAGGRTIPELEKELASKYANGFLQNPQVSVFVKEYSSQRITLEGAIIKPGIYPITGKTTLLQAIALSGGVDDKVADLGGIVLMRQINGKRMAAVYDLRAVRRGTMEDPQVYGDDIIVVETSGSKSAYRRFIESIPAFGIFNWLHL